MSSLLISTAKFDRSGDVSTKTLEKSKSKIQWTVDEDQKLLEWVNQNGTKKWSEIAKILAGRTGKHCRERWHNFVCPDIKRGPWSQDEDDKLIEGHKKYGKRWCKIAVNLKGRTDTVIKSHWTAAKLRLQTKRKKSALLPSATNDLEKYLLSIGEDKIFPKKKKTKADDATADDDQPAQQLNNNKFNIDLNFPPPDEDTPSTSVHIPTEASEHVSYTP